MKLRGEWRKVTNTATGRLEDSPYPVSRAEALREGVAFYYPAGAAPCSVPSHRAGTSLIYAVSDIMKCCAYDNAMAAYRAARIADEPLNPGEAAEKMLPYYWGELPGQYCGHVGKVTLKGKCWECSQVRVNSPRQAALAAGETWYTPADGDLCKHGHAARRRVANGGCEECEKQSSGVDARRLDLFCGPDTVMSREEARLCGSLVYRTGAACKYGHKGWRYLSTGACLVCKSGE